MLYEGKLNTILSFSGKIRERFRTEERDKGTKDGGDGRGYKINDALFS
jgi:hypothetical protein